LRNAMPRAEVVLWIKLKEQKLNGYKFRRQHGVGNYVVDFYCSHVKLAIEVDGESHFISSGPKRDETRTQFLQKQGIRVLRIMNNDIYSNINGVLTTIERTIKEIETRKI